MNPVLLQKQLRDNVSDLEQFSRDLQNWGEEMKRKEESFKKTGSPSKLLKKSSPKSRKSPKISSRIGSTDYSKWEKFNADAECDKLEEDFEDDSDLTDEVDEKVHDEAMLEKEKGNELVKKKEWDDAIKYYTKAIKLYSYDPVFYANRALCYLKKCQYFNAEKDCTLSLKLDKTYVKALQRRAAANEGLNNFEAAEFDLVQVLKFEPNNKESKVALDNIRKKLGKQTKPEEQRPVSKFTASRNKIQPYPEQPSSSTSSGNNVELDTTSVPIITKVSEKADIREHKPTDINNHNEAKKDDKKVSIWPEHNDLILVKPIKKPPHMRSKKPLKRIEIVEVDKSEKLNKVQTQPVTEIAVKTMQRKMEEKISEKILEQTMKNVTFKDCVDLKNIDEMETTKPSSTFKMKRDKLKAVLDNESSGMAWPKPNDVSTTFKTDDLKILERKLEQENLNETKTQIQESNTSRDKNLAIEQDEHRKYVTPKNSVQFYTMWRDSSTPEEKYKILQQMDPSEIPNIFKESLDFNVFSAILNILVTHFVNDRKPVYDILSNFSEVKRFSTFTMFMDSTDKNRLWKLVNYMREIEMKNKEAVDNLVQKYEL